MNYKEKFKVRFEDFKKKLTVYTLVQMMFILCSLILLDVAFSNYFDVQARDIETLSREVKELRYQSKTMSSRYMNEAKQSNVIQKVKSQNLGLKELTDAPRIIYDED